MIGTAPTDAAGYSRSTAPRTALRELLEATLEWTAPSGPSRALALDGVRYRLTPLTAGAGGAAVLCESPHRAAIPGYVARRRIRGRLAGTPNYNLVIFTDSAHSALVWSWNERGAVDEVVYRELSFTPGEAWGPLRPVLESIAAAPAEVVIPDAWSTDERPAPVQSATDLLSAVAHRIDDESSGESPRVWAQAVQDAVMRAVGAEGIRACWRALLASRIDDARCGDGEWLEIALSALVPAYEACLRRMDIALDDFRRGRPPPRRDRLSDFGRVTARAGGSRHSIPRKAFATELALLHNLFGSDSELDAVRACRSRLIGHLSMPGTGVRPELLSLNIVQLDSEDRDDGGGAVKIGVPSRRAADAPEDGKVEIVRRAVSTILRMHMDGALALDELSRALAAASRRLENRAGMAPSLPWSREHATGPGPLSRGRHGLGLSLTRRSGSELR